MTGAEAAVRDADKAEAAQMKLQRAAEKLARDTEKSARAQARAKTRLQAVERAQVETQGRAKEREEPAAVDDELLTEIADIDSDHYEIIFSTPISPPQARDTMLIPPSPIARPTTPEIVKTRKRTGTLVYRTPEKPRALPVAPTTPSIPSSEISQEDLVIVLTPQETVKIPSSTSPARLNGRVRREGKNSAYLKAMAIERGRGRGGRA